MKKVFIEGVRRGSGQEIVEEKTREVLMRASNNLSWLKRDR